MGLLQSIFKTRVTKSFSKDDLDKAWQESERKITTYRNRVFNSVTSECFKFGHPKGLFCIDTLSEIPIGVMRDMGNAFTQRRFKSLSRNHAVDNNVDEIVLKKIFAVIEDELLSSTNWIGLDLRVDLPPHLLKEMALLCTKR